MLIPNVSGLMTTTALNTKISGLVRKTDCYVKINEIENNMLDHKHDKYIAPREFHKLTADNSAPRLKQANLAIKPDIDNFVEKTDFDDKLKNLNKNVTSKKTKHVEVKKKLTDLTKKLHKFRKKDMIF